MNYILNLFSLVYLNCGGVELTLTTTMKPPRGIAIPVAPLTVHGPHYDPSVAVRGLKTLHGPPHVGREIGATHTAGQPHNQSTNIN